MPAQQASCKLVRTCWPTAAVDNASYVSGKAAAAACVRWVPDTPTLLHLIPRPGRVDAQVSSCVLHTPLVTLSAGNDTAGTEIFQHTPLPRQACWPLPAAPLPAWRRGSRCKRAHSRRHLCLSSTMQMRTRRGSASSLTRFTMTACPLSGARRWRNSRRACDSATESSW